MKAVLEEYGMILVVIAVVLIFILFATPFGNAIVAYIEDALAKFYAEAMKTTAAPEFESTLTPGSGLGQ
jgi:hypothetical protein